MVSSEGHSAALAANFVFHSFSEGGGGGVGEGGEVLARPKADPGARGSSASVPTLRPSRFHLRARVWEGPAGLGARFAARARAQGLA